MNKSISFAASEVAEAHRAVLLRFKDETSNETFARVLWRLTELAGQGLKPTELLERVEVDSKLNEIVGATSPSRLLICQELPSFLLACSWAMSDFRDKVASGHIDLVGAMRRT